MGASKSLTPAQRSQRSRIAAYTRWATENPTATAIRGQAGLRARFYREIAAAHPELCDAEVTRRADNAYRAHMSRLSYASAKVRAARKAASVPATDGGDGCNK